MRYEITLSPQAPDDLRSLKAHLRAALRDGIERHPRHGSTQESQRRIKRLKAESYA